MTLTELGPSACEYREHLSRGGIVSVVRRQPNIHVRLWRRIVALHVAVAGRASDWVQEALKINAWQGLRRCQKDAMRCFMIKLLYD